MPAAIAGAIVSAIGLTGTAALVVGTVIQLAVSYGLNALVQSAFGPGQPKPSDVQRVVRQSVGSRVRHYGTVHTGGQLIFQESKNATLYSVVATGHGEISSILEHRLNNKVVVVNGSGLVTDTQYRDRISLFSKLGSTSQTAFSELTSVFPEWTADHRARGCSLSLMICRPESSESFGDVYEGNREPAYSRVIESTMVYDPREDSTQTGGSGVQRLGDSTTWSFSENAALILADYLCHSDGYGLGYSSMNWNVVSREADICDSTIVTVDSRSIPQWRISGSYNMAESQRKSVLAEMLRACDAFMWQDEMGLVSFVVGRWMTPTVTITDDHTIAATASVGGDPQSSTNEVRVVYTDPRLGYTETEAFPTIDSAAQILRGQEVQRYDVYLCPDHNQAARLGKRFLAKLTDRWNLTLSVNLFGLNVIGERFIFVSLSELGIDNIAFEVTALSLDLGSGIVELGLVEVRQEDFQFDSSLEEGTPPPVPLDTEPTDGVPVPQGLTSSTSQTSSGLTLVSSWNENINRPDLTVDAQYRNSANSSWLPMSVAQSERVATASGINSGTSYSVRVRYVTLSGLVSEWSSESTTSGTVTEMAPSVPTEFSGQMISGSTELQWRNPAESNFSYVDIYRSQTDNFPTAVTVGPDQVGGLAERMSYTETPTSGTYFYWLVSRSSSGLQSQETLSISVTIP